MRLLAATRAGVVEVTDGSSTLKWGGDVQRVVRDGGRVYAGTEDAGVVCSDDEGASWRGLGLADVRIRSLAVSGRTVVAGAQPVAVHVSYDAGATWRRLDQFPRRPYWWQPARSPHTQGYVSALAVDGETILAGIEAFKGFRSVDGGRSWRPLRRGFSRDCHELVLAHGRAYEGAGLGPAWSLDGGARWRRLRAGLDRRYVMAIGVDPLDADCWYAAAAPLSKAHSRDSHAVVFRWSGERWTAVTEELPELPYSLHCPAPDAVVAGLRDGTILASGDRGASWHTLAHVEGLRALA